MGTSTSQRSPNTPSWNLANAILGRPDVPSDLQTQELWRAAVADREGRLAFDLGSAALIAAGEIAESARSATEATRAFDQRVADTKEVGIFTDIARRALVRAIDAGGGASRYATELFGEAASYYASRDLSSFVAARGRVSSTTEAIALKSAIKAHTREIVSAVGPPPLSPESWRGYVGRVLGRLSGHRGRGRVR